MTAPLVDTTDFQLVAEPGEDEAEDIVLLAEMEEKAKAFLASTTLPPRKNLLLAYALTGVIALYLAQFETPIPSGESEGDMERWVVVGDMPSIHFETYDADSREAALRLYCAICQAWAFDVLAGRGRHQEYPIVAPPTQVNAKSLLGRIKFIRHKIVPQAGGAAPSLRKQLSDKMLFVRVLLRLI